MEMQVQNIVTNAFLKEWNRLIVQDSTIPISLKKLVPLSEDVKNTILSEFKLENVQHNLILEEKRNPARFVERHHINNLRIIAQKYAQILYLESDKGKNLDPITIGIAHMFLLTEGKCHSMYPCI